MVFLLKVPRCLQILRGKIVNVRGEVLLYRTGDIIGWSSPRIESNGVLVLPLATEVDPRMVVEDSTIMRCWDRLNLGNYSWFIVLFEEWAVGLAPTYEIRLRDEAKRILVNYANTFDLPVIRNELVFASAQPTYMQPADELLALSILIQKFG